MGYAYHRNKTEKKILLSCLKSLATMTVPPVSCTVTDLSAKIIINARFSCVQFMRNFPTTFNLVPTGRSYTPKVMDGPSVLLRNNGDGAFTPATAAANITVPKYASAALFVDVDADGDEDLFVATYGGARHYLFINDGLVTNRSP